MQEIDSCIKVTLGFDTHPAEMHSILEFDKAIY